MAASGLNLEYFTYPHALAMTGTRMRTAPGRSSPSSGNPGDPARDGFRLFDSGSDRGSDAEDGADSRIFKRGFAISAWPGASRSTVSGTDASYVKGRSSRFGYSPPQVMREVHWAWRCALWHRYLDRPRVSAEASGRWRRPSTVPGTIAPYADAMNGSLLGPSFSHTDIQTCIERHGCIAREVAPAQLAQEIAGLLADQKVVGLLQGRMEYGPRALGSRSIIADARSQQMQSLLNLKNEVS